MKASIDEFWKFVLSYFYIFGVGFIVGGFAMTFFGYKVLKGVIVFSVAIVFMTLCCGFIYGFLRDYIREDWHNWVVLGTFCHSALGGTAAIGIFLGLLCLKIIKAGIFIVGAVGGAALGLILYQAFICYISTTSKVG